jgi:hypothetical protein
MTPDPDTFDFVSIGDFSPRDARRFMAALASAHIEFRAEFDDGIVRETGSLHRGFGMDAQISLSVDAQKLPEVEKIKTELFGEFTP